MHEDIPSRRSDMTMNRLLRDQVQEFSPRFTRLMINHSNVSCLERKINSTRGFSEIKARTLNKRDFNLRSNENDITDPLASDASHR